MINNRKRNTNARSRAEEAFAAAQKRDKEALTERETAREERARQVAQLKAKRLAKEAEDKDTAAPVKPGTKTKGKVVSPRFHRF